MKDIMRFSKNDKVNPHYIDPLEIPNYVGQRAYRLALPPSLFGFHHVFHVLMLKKYHQDEDYIIKWDLVLLDKNFHMRKWKL